jgi:hypothetical protein
VAGLNGHANGSRTMVTSAGPVGEIIDTSVAQFAAQACTFGAAPPFGGFVKVLLPERAVYGLVYAIHSGSLEPGGRPVMRGRDGLRDGEIYRTNPDLEQVLRTEFAALIVGFEEDARWRAYLPPSPPPLHWSVYECSEIETARLTDGFDYFRSVLAAPDVPADALLAANVRLSRRARTDDPTFAVRAGRELATLLKHDYPRLTAILRTLSD